MPMITLDRRQFEAAVEERCTHANVSAVLSAVSQGIDAHAARIGTGSVAHDIFVEASTVVARLGKLIQSMEDATAEEFTGDYSGFGRKLAARIGDIGVGASASGRCA